MSVPWSEDFCGRHPAFETLADAAAIVEGAHRPSLPALERVVSVEGVRNARGMPLLVRDEGALRDATAVGYETRILDQGVIAVQPGSWHDLFNVLVWRTFPRTKATLNDRHVAELRRDPGERLRRGRLRDALTLFDESGAILAASDASMLDALRGFRWKELFWTRRAEFDRCVRLHVFGHAVYEKLLAPYLGLTAHAVLVDVDQAVIEAPCAERIELLDRRVAALLREDAGLRSPRDLHPVPLLGLPGWHAEAACEAFYANADYFRPGRRAPAMSGAPRGPLIDPHAGAAETRS
jgi:hypothetical protein